MARRKSYNLAQRRKIWEAAQDKDGNVNCWRCGLRIDVMKEGWHVGHVGIAHSFGGEKVAPEHVKCNMDDCYKVVIPAVAKSNRVWSRHHEKRKPAKMRRRLDGSVQRRCEECGKNWADWPSKICPGCEAYREHTA